MPADADKKPLSPAKRLLGLMAFVVVIGGSMWIGRTLASHTSSPGVSIVQAGPFAPILLMALGIVLLFIGAAAYGIVLATGAMTFRYDRGPIFRGVKVRMWFANLIVGLFLQSGFAVLVGPFVLIVLGQLLPLPLAAPVSFFGPFIVAQLAMVWLQIWGPLERIVITRRLLGMNILREALAGGVYVGLSDPNKNSFKKFTAVEDDVGVLWFSHDRLVYRGDAQAWQVMRGQLLDVERKADAGSTSSYFGAVHIIVRFIDDTGAEQRWRLHSEGDLTMSGRARSLDRLAAALDNWREGHVPTPQPQGPAGFEVRVGS
jgi:hypothetical protein